MKTMIKFLPVLSVVIVLVAANLQEKEEEHHLGHKSHSDKHYQHGEHNPEYDHEAFLGEEAKTFDQLSPEESKRRLGLIVDKIDKDKNGLVTQDELTDWIDKTQKKYIQDDANQQWKTHNPNAEEKLLWAKYKKNVYGFMDEMDAKELEKDQHGTSYAQMLKRDRRRWQMSDADQDDALTRDEFAAFLHPEEVDSMKDLIVVETLEDIDKDGDGLVSLEEYIGDMYRGGPDEEEPDWVSSERQQFAQFRDKDGDGFMDRDEVKEWIVPKDFNHAEAEARHLIYESDGDSDQKLTKEEIIAKYDVFVGSQATDFGEALSRHDEF